MRALVIEDDSAYLSLMEEVLKEASFQEISKAVNLDEALGYIREARFDLYLCDGDFPLTSSDLIAADGAFFIFYNHLLKAHNSPRVIMLSINEFNVKQAREMGIEAYQKDEVDIDSLVSRLRGD